jgi:hypothetical protein
MRLLDAQSGGHRADDLTLEGESERPPVGAPPSADELLARLQRDLEDVDSVRLLESSWLACTDLRAALEPVLRAFRSRGGVVSGVSGGLAGR